MAGDEDADHGDHEAGQDRAHEDARQCCRPGDPSIVQSSQGDHGNDGDQSLSPPDVGDDIRAEGQRDGGTGRRLADEEGPAGGKAPPRSEPFSSVDVRAAGCRVDGGELSGRDGVAERHERCDHQTQQQPGARGSRRGAERREHAGADHRTQADEHGVAKAEPASQTWIGPGQVSPRPLVGLMAFTTCMLSFLRPVPAVADVTRPRTSQRRGRTAVWSARTACS